MSDQRYAVWHPFTGMPHLEEMTPEAVRARFSFMTRGEGSWVYDQQGKAFLNLLNAASSLGLGRPDILAAITAQYERLSFHPLFAQGHEQAERLASRLLARSPLPDGLVFYATDGTGTVETALKLARLYFMATGQPDRTQFISLEGAYHGTSYGALSVTQMGMDPLFQPMVPGCHAVPFPNTFRPPAGVASEEVSAWAIGQLEAKLAEIGPNRVAGILLEPIQGVKGCRPLPAAYIEAVCAMTQRYGILLIADEVTTGLGRTGEWFATESWPTPPDMICLAKGLTAGYFPLGATLVAPRLFQPLASMGFPHGTTAAGHPVGCATALAVLDLLEREDLVEGAARQGARLLAALQEAIGQHLRVGEIRGRGMMLGIEFVEDRATMRPPGADLSRAIRRLFAEAGLLVAYMDGITTLYPPLTLSDAEEQELTQRIIQAVNALPVA